MKLKDELIMVISKLETIKDKIPQHIEAVRKSGGYQNLERRIAWDCLRAVVGTTTICEWYDKYNCNDDHIATLAIKALRKIGINVK